MSEQQVKNILFIGATGWLGNQIAHAILDKKAFHVKVLVRKDTLHSKESLINGLKSKGASIVTGDVGNVSELTEAAKGSDTIVSVLSGNSLFGGEENNLVAAAKGSGTVKRIVPSQYGVDISTLSSPGFLAAKVSTLEEIKKAGLEYTVIATGMFYEFLFGAFLGLGAESNSIVVLGDGNGKLSGTATADIAKFVPEILLDPHSKNQTIRVAGVTVTPLQAKAIYEQATGKSLNVVHKNIPDLKKDFEAAPPQGKFVPWLQELVLTEPKTGSLEALTDNWRYPNVVPLSPREFLTQKK